MSRLEPIERKGLSPENQTRWDRIMEGKSGGLGPYAILMYAPAMAEHLSDVENYFRHHGMLDTQDKELIILTVARELGARFPWSRHEVRAHRAGMREETIEALRADGPLDALTERERFIVDLTRSLLHQRRLSDALFSKALDDLGPERLVETVGLVSHYNMISSVGNVFGLEPPEGTVTF